MSGTMILTKVMIDAGIEHFNGLYNLPVTRFSIYLTNNICIKCMLKYPKNHNVCVSCNKALRRVPKNKKTWWNKNGY